MNDGLKVVPQTTVGSLVPTMFDAYARVQYPLRDSGHVARWHVQQTAIIEVLARSTNAPNECWFAVWEGNTALNDIREMAPTANIAGYNYFLLRGPVSRATDTLRGLSPNLWWPADHAWCVAQHFDFPCAYLGSSAETIADILALTGIESSPVGVEQITTACHDEND
ncbi:MULTISPECIES: hypothetical protein [unclassified Rhodococcus (in: high G+C Gram-positive bacteria)]|uniref:hypothetical protein n=1 Tax=unclassified Rhodococcus (in: high G+C Gram-positive bacteria) TaxID=192944 RepID=UPI00117A077F|nr:MULTISPECIES: hypothetical protein [unclassified Rhodococcus (in: high G+C Gram-positive bacteria)]